MPLIDGDSSEALHQNIRELIAAGHPADQAAAIAYAHARKTGKTKHLRTDAVPSHVVSLARAHAAAIKQRSSGGHFTAGHSVRGRIPLQQHPDAIEASYAKAIKDVLGIGRAALKPLLDKLPTMLAAARKDAAELERRTVAGLPIVIENPAGSLRHWTDSDGTTGTTLMRWDYGYIDGVVGADGDEVDVYIGPVAEPAWVYVIHQRSKASGFEEYDEDKAMLGWSSADAAKAAYLAQYNDPRFYGGMSVMDIDYFKAALVKCDGDKLTHREDADRDLTYERLVFEDARRKQAAATSTSKVETLIDQYANATSAFQREQIARQVKAALGINISFTDPELKKLMDAFVHENVSLIRTLGTKQLDDVEKIIMYAMRTDADPEDVAATLADKFAIADRHAQLIARDQIGRLNGQMNAARQQEIGITKFRVRTRRDGNVRPSHRALEGKAFSYDDLPIVDGEKFTPGDPIACRCIGEPVFDDVKAAVRGR